jgi:hypothetical protein
MLRIAVNPEHVPLKSPEKTEGLGEFIRRYVRRPTLTVDVGGHENLHYGGHENPR